MVGSVTACYSHSIRGPLPSSPHSSPASFPSFLPTCHLLSRAGGFPMPQAHRFLSSQHFANAVPSTCNALPSLRSPSSHLVYSGEPSPVVDIMLLPAYLEGRRNSSFSHISPAHGGHCFIIHTLVCIPVVVGGHSPLTGVFLWAGMCCIHLLFRALGSESKTWYSAQK